MKITLNRSISGLFFAILGVATFTSCSEDFPSNVESDKYTDLKSIRIVNAGPQGNEVLEGAIDESTKTITFPRIDTLSNFENIKFEAVTSDGAKLAQDIYAIPYASGDTEKEIFLKVTNLPRFKEYKAKIRFKVPVYGAGFETPTVYDYSTNQLGNPIYESFITANTRGSGFDGKNVLVIDRGSLGSHLLSVEKLKNNVIERTPLNMTGVAGGTYTVNMGAQINGHSYIANLSGGVASQLKIYHWSSPTQAPDEVININVANLIGAGARNGDSFSINVNKDGNGYAFFMSGTGQIIRVKITNFKTGSEPTVIVPKINYEQWGHFTQIGDTESYILSGHSQPFSLVNNSASITYTMKATSIARSLSDIKIFNFNGHRYLLGITVPRNTPTTAAELKVYNITKGGNIVDALTALEQTAVDGKTAPAVYSITLSSVVNAQPGSQTGYYITKDASGKDQKLTIYGATTQGGFTIVDFGVAVAQD